MTAESDLLADLCMTAQGFRPPAPRLLQLCAQDLLWTFPSKPPQFGMTQKGKSELIRLLCEALDASPEDASLARIHDQMSVTSYAQGMNFLDVVECSVRSMQPFSGTVADIGFVVWLIQRLPDCPEGTPQTT